MNDEDKTMIEEAEGYAGEYPALVGRLAARLRAVLEELNDAKNERDAMVETNAANVHTSEAAQEAYFAIKDELDLSNRALALQTKALAEVTKLARIT